MGNKPQLYKFTVPKDNHIACECDETCVTFHATYSHDRKQQAGITHVPGIDPADMPQPNV